MQHNLPGGRQRFPSITQCLLSKFLTFNLHVLLHTTHSLHTWCRAEIWWHSLQQKTANVWFPQVCELHAHPPDRTPTQAGSKPASSKPLSFSIVKKSMIIMQRMGKRETGMMRRVSFEKEKKCVFAHYVVDYIHQLEFRMTLHKHLNETLNTRGGDGFW